MLVIWPGQIRTKPFNHSDAQPWGIEQVGIKFKRRYAVSPVENFANVAPPAFDASAEVCADLRGTAQANRVRPAHKTKLIRL